MFCFTGLEPAEKRPRLSLKMAPDGLDEGEGTLVINTSDPNHTVSHLTVHNYSELVVLGTWRGSPVGRVTALYASSEEIDPLV